MTEAELLAALEAADTNDAALAVLARFYDPDAEPPTSEALADWWPDCPAEAKADALADLRKVQAPGGVCRWDVRDGSLQGVLQVAIPAPALIPEPPTPHPRPPSKGKGKGRKGLSATAYAGGPSVRLWWGFPPRALTVAWLELVRRGVAGPHPLAAVVKAWRDRPRDLERRHLIVTRERRPPKGRDPLTLVRSPSVLHLATLAAVEVDGDPFATERPGAPKVRRYRVATPDVQASLFPAPRKLMGSATGGVLIEAVADLELCGDERNPIRGDLLWLGDLAFALTSAAKVADAEGAVLVGGRDTEANRRRFNDALWALRWLRIEVRPGIFWALVDSEPGETNRIGPPRWWTDRWRAAKGLRGEDRRAALAGAPVKHALTGSLFRPALLASAPRGTGAGYWGTVQRTVAGIEAALCYGPTAGAGKGGRIPDALRPIRPGGPGPECFVPAWQVLRLSGEHVAPGPLRTSALRMRYKRRIEGLKAANYFTARTGTAPAGDTVEVVERRIGGRARAAGIVVRASARFCAAQASGDRVRIPAARLIAPHR